MFLLLLSCSPELSLVSPLDGSEISAPWVPLFVDLGTLKRVGQEPEIRLDGRVLEQPFGASHDRYDRLGESYDWIGYLELAGLQPGEYGIKAHFGRRGEYAEARFEYAPPEHRVRLQVQNSEGDPLWARVLLFDGQGEPISIAGPEVLQTDPRHRDTGLHTLNICEGEGEIWLDSGDYTLVFARGIRDSVQVVELSVDQDSSVLAVLDAVVPTPGWSTSELHLHTAWSPDSFLPGEVRYDSLPAADVQLALLSDHDMVRDPGELIEQRYGTLLTVVAGLEASMRFYDEEEQDWDSIGHVNLMPWEGEAPNRNFETIADMLQAHAPAELRQLNHPRGIEFSLELGAQAGVHAFLSALRVPVGNPTLQTERSEVVPADDLWGSFQAMEVMNRFSWSLYKVVRLDWMALWKAGYPVSGTGNSDTHAQETELVGFPVNLTPCPPEGGVDPVCVREAVAAGRLRVSTGPVVSIELAQSGPPVSEGSLLTLAGSDPVLATLRIQAAEWVPVHELRLIVDGDTQRSWSLLDAERDAAGVLDFSVQVEVDLSTGDHFVLAEAGYPVGQAAPEDYRGELGVYAMVAPSYLPVGWTNPVQIDGDRDGEWRP